MNRSELKAKAKQCLGGGIFQTNWLTALLGCIIVTAVTSLSAVTAVGPIIVLGPITYGLSLFFLNQARSGSAFNIVDLFAGFKDCFLDSFLIGLLTTVFTCLWSLLFIIPGIVKSYAYSMAFNVKVDHPDYDWRQCIEESKRLTNGHKGELFMLDMSFIGWLLVGALCLGIGTLWVTPYISATKTQAYLALTAANAAPVEN